MRRTLLLPALLAAMVAGCGDDDDAPAPSGATAAAASTSAPAASAAPQPPAATEPAASSTAVESTEATTAATADGDPPVEQLADLGAETIASESSVDWTLVAFDRVWISGIEGGVGVYDVADGTLQRSIAVPEEPCGAMDAGFGSVWTRTCGTPGVVRLSRSGKVVARVPIGPGKDGETSVGVGEGAVWVIDERASCTACLIARIDPAANAVTDRIELTTGANAVRAGLGGVWVASYDAGAVYRIDPQTLEVGDPIELSRGVLFLDVGEGGVWVLNQEEGTVTRIDPATSEVVATIPVESFVDGGDLTVGGGYVWVRGTRQLVAQIDPATNTVVRRIGAGAGSGSASAGNGWLWASAHDESSIYRIPLDATR